jgi:hypothetical protein
MSEQSNQVQDLIWRLERQYPLWPSTFSTCECKAHMARGADRCADCLEEELAGVIGKPLAWEVHHALKSYQQIKAFAIHGE